MVCLVHLDCSCYLNSNGNIIIREKECESEREFTSSILHGLNLPLLQTFYDITNDTVSGRTLYAPEELKTPQAIHLPIFGNNISQILAADTVVGYSLDKLALSLRNESVIFHSPADALLHKLIQEVSTPRSFWRFEVDSWLPWTSCKSFIVSVFVLYLWYTTHRRLIML
jgi:hypothetical protein